jgi:hypothetical protein
MARLSLLVVLGIFLTAPLFGQSKQPQIQRRPAANAPASDVAPVKTPDGSGASYILDGLPMYLTIHHDTVVGTNKPVDVFVLVIEMQVMNSDGNLEPVGLQFFNFFTVGPQRASQDVNPRNGHDCKLWYGLQRDALLHRNPTSKTWPYLEFVTAVGARVVQTNEDGAVWWSDDIECWGSSDRFPPF